MALFLRIVMTAALIGVTLTGCSRFSRQEAPAETPAETPPPVAVTAEPVLVELDDVTQSIGSSPNQAAIETAINEARLAGYDDTQIAEAMGMAWLRRPGRRVMISVVYVRFKNDSLTDVAELDEAYQYGRTPPAMREAAAAAAVAEEDEDEEEEDEPRRRRRGWFSWIPGL